MGGTAILTVGGAFDGQTGVLSVPSALPSSINSLLQTYLDGVTGSVTGGTASFVNYNAVTGLALSVTGSGSNVFEEITNIDSTGASSSGAPAGVVSVASGVTDLLVQYPGSITVDGSASTSTAIFGAGSNVTYSLSGALSNGTGSIFAGGGNDLIADYGANSSYNITSSGNDTVVANGTGGTDSINAVGSATTAVYVGGSDVVTVTASGDAVAPVVFFENSGSSLYFVNNSSETQTIFSGAYTAAGGGSVYATNAVTAFGGAGGGYFFGGRAGYNYLDGGTGNSTLVGAGAHDTLVSGGADNSLYAGNASETLLGGGGTNSFFVGLEEVGIGTVQALGDLVSSNGSGSQIFTLGNVGASTLVGSTVAGAQNIYDVLGTYTTQGGDAVTFGGSTFTITDFGGTDTIYLLDGSYNFGADAPTVESVISALGDSGSTQILLSDNTVITLKGVSTSHVNAAIGGNSITYQ